MAPLRTRLLLRHYSSRRPPRSPRTLNPSRPPPPADPMPPPPLGGGGSPRGLTAPNVVFGVVAGTCGAVFALTSSVLSGAAEQRRQAPPAPEGRPPYAVRDGRLQHDDPASSRPSLLRRAQATLTPTFIRDHLILFPYNLAAGRWWTLLTPTLAHATLLHLAANMLVLFSFGRGFVARFGAARFAAVWVGGGLASSVATLAAEGARKRREGERYVERGSLGASGALAALTTVMVALRPWGEVVVMPLVSARSRVDGRGACRWWDGADVRIAGAHGGVEGARGVRGVQCGVCGDGEPAAPRYVTRGLGI